MAQVMYRKPAAKALARMPAKIAQAFRDAFSAIAEGKEAGLDICRLQGRPGYRLRIGGYRAIYERLENGGVVVVVLRRPPLILAVRFQTVRLGLRGSRFIEGVAAGAGP